MTLQDAFPRPRTFAPIKDWNRSHAAVTAAEIHGQVVKDFAPLTGLKKLKALRCSCRGRKQYDALAQLKSLEFLSLSYCDAGELAGIGQNNRLRALELDCFTPPSLEGIEVFKELEFLSVFHAPKITSLAPLAELKKLKWLSISTPPSWDSSRKTIKVESFEPLSRLAGLQYLSLDGVEPRKGGLQALGKLKSLKELDFGHVYNLTMDDYAGLAAALPKTKGHCLEPHYHLNFKYPCKTCGTNMVFLTAPKPRARQQLCPKCDVAAVAAHVDAFEQAKKRARL